MISQDIGNEKVLSSSDNYVKRIQIYQYVNVFVNARNYLIINNFSKKICLIVFFAGSRFILVLRQFTNRIHFSNLRDKYLGFTR